MVTASRMQNMVQLRKKTPISRPFVFSFVFLVFTFRALGVESPGGVILRFLDFGEAYPSPLDLQGRSRPMVPFPSHTLIYKPTNLMGDLQTCLNRK